MGGPYLVERGQGMQKAQQMKVGYGTNRLVRISMRDKLAGNIAQLLALADNLAVLNGKGAVDEQGGRMGREAMR